MTRAESTAKARRQNLVTRDLAPVFDDIRAEGHLSLKKIADALALRGIPSPTGKLVWEVNQVRLCLDRVRPRAPVSGQPHPGSA
jgi:hypothetical protein